MGTETALNLWCKQKIRNKRTNAIIGYEVEHILSGEIRRIASDELKSLIQRGEVDVFNLKLTSDGRLVDRKSNLKPRQ